MAMTSLDAIISVTGTAALRPGGTLAAAGSVTASGAVAFPTISPPGRKARIIRNDTALILPPSRTRAPALSAAQRRSIAVLG